MTDKIKRGDLLPAWSATLYDDATPVNLSSASSMKVIFTKPDGTVVARAIAGPYSAVGVVSMDWQAGDTSQAGDIVAEVEVMWPGSKPQTFPPDDYLVTRVYQDEG